MLKTFWMIVAKIANMLTATLVGGIFFFAIIGVFGIWIAIPGLLVAFVVLGYSFGAYWVFRGKTPERGWDGRVRGKGRSFGSQERT
jgi:hypothetical protein